MLESEDDNDLEPFTSVTVNSTNPAPQPVKTLFCNGKRLVHHVYMAPENVELAHVSLDSLEHEANTDALNYLNSLLNKPVLDQLGALSSSKPRRILARGARNSGKGNIRE